MSRCRPFQSAVPFALIVLAATGCQPSDGVIADDNGHGSPAAVATPAAIGSGAEPVDTTDTGARVVHWQCNEVGVTSTWSADGTQVALAFSGRELVLPGAASASGTRHADAAGNAFRTKGDSGTFTLAGEARRDCERSERVSPWNDAAARGIGFRAVGNEPGWYLEVGTGQAPSLHAVLDYGERTLDIAHLQPAGPGWTGETSAGESVALRVRHEACRDGMSGESFEASAELRVGERTWAGCGAFLSE